MKSIILIFFLSLFPPLFFSFLLLSSVANAEVITLQSSVLFSTDDAEEHVDGSVSLKSSDLELIFDKSNQTVGIRFTNLVIPQNAAITKAYIQFQVDESDFVEGTVLNIQGEKTDNALTFTTVTHNISSRSKTSASVLWSPVDWSTVGEAGVDQRTSDLTSIIQEIVDQTGWNAGNAMAFIVTGEGKRVAESYNGDQVGAPMLYVEYITEVGPDTTAPVITILGANPMYLSVGDIFTDSGATALDNVDGNITSLIQTSNDVNTSLVGTYSVTYTVSDTVGNPATASRSVIVSDSSSDPHILNVPSDYASLHEAFSNAVDGDTILLALGTYNVTETLYIDKNNITIASRYLLSGDKNDIDNTIINGVLDKHLIDGVSGESANLKLIGLTINDAEKGITFTDDYGEVHYCKFNNILRDSISFDTNAGGAVTYTRVENSGDDAIDIDTRYNGSFLIAYNELIDSGNDTIEVHLYNSTSPTHMYYDIHDNLISGADEDGIQLIDEDENSNRSFDIYRNIFEGMKDVSISSSIVTGEDFNGVAMAERVRIYNNYFNGGQSHIIGGDNMIILNNIFEAATVKSIYRVKIDSITDYNIFYNNAVNTSDTITGSNNLFADPKINPDYTLQTGSPAIDAGTVNYVHNAETVLTIPVSEYIGTNLDMGRYEYGLDTAPVITILGANPMYLSVGDIFTDSGATALDNVDGDITSLIQTSNDVNTSLAGTYSVTYTVSDTVGNPATASRSVIVSDPVPDTTPPVLTLIGANPMHLSVGDIFTDSGATALDNVDGNITSLIQTSNDVNTSLVGTYSVTYTVSDTVGNPATASRSVIVSSGSSVSQTLQSSVASNTDDAEERGDGSMYLNSSDLELIFDKSNQTVGIRFTNLNIPQDAIITKSYIQFKVDEDDFVVGTLLTIEAEKTDNALTFTTVTHNISSRSRTTASVSWSPVRWDTIGVAGVDQRTSDLTSIIQEIVDQTGWNAGNAMAFIVTGEGKRVAESYNGDQAGAPMLYVEYSMDISKIPPVITLIGDNLINLNIDDTFIDPGATAQDFPDGDITTSIESSSNVNTAVTGVYEVIYTVTDSDENSDTETRRVTITDPDTTDTLNLTSYIKRTAADADILGDLEGMCYIDMDNEFMIADDSEDLVYGLSLATERTTRIIDDEEFAAFTQDNYPNIDGDEPLASSCHKDSDTGLYTGFCDVETIAYNPIFGNETMYVFTGNHPGELTTFKLTRSAPDQNLTIVDWRRIDQERSAAIVIEGQLYVSNEEVNLIKYDWDAEVTFGDIEFVSSSKIEDMAYDNGILWVVTANNYLHKIDWVTKVILDSYDLVSYDIQNPRGVEVVGDKLYIGDGDNNRADDLNNAIHVFDLP